MNVIKIITSALVGGLIFFSLASLTQMRDKGSRDFTMIMIVINVLALVSIWG